MSDLVSQNVNMIFKSPKGETVHALKDISFTLKKGELLTVLGPSGCGKTTLLNIAAGFLRPTSGSINLGGKEIWKKPIFTEIKNGDILGFVGEILKNLKMKHNLKKTTIQRKKLINKFSINHEKKKLN